MAADNREQIMKDIEALSLEKYVDEIAGAVIEGLGRCKTEKDVWSAVEVSLHRMLCFCIHKRVPDHISFTSAVLQKLYACIGFQHLFRH